MGSHAGVQKAAAKRLGLTAEEYRSKLESGLKWCTACRAWIAAGSFGVDRSRSDGRSSKCCACRLPERKTVGPGRTERRSQRTRGLAWCSRCEAWLSAADVRGGLCRAHLAAAARERYASDPKHRAERRQHAHSPKRGVEPVPVEGGESRLDTFQGRCWYCGEPATTWDHLIPVSRGGETVPNNIVPACGSCNSSKGDREIHAWLNSRSHPFLDVTIDNILYLLEEQGYDG